MAVENKVAVGATATDNAVSHGMGGDVKCFSATVEISASATNASTYDLGFVPLGARILGISTYSIDDCDTGSTATVDFGFASVDSNFTTDADALNDGIVLGTAARDQPLVKGIESYGKKAWQFISGATATTKGLAKLQASIQDGAISAAGGTLTVECYFLVP